MDSKLADTATRSQAEYGLAMTLELMARAKPPADRDLLELSLSHYENVVYGTNLGDNEKGDASWVGTAGLAAGKLAEDLHEWDHAVRLYDRLKVILPPLQNMLEPKRAKAQKSLFAEFEDAQPFLQRCKRLALSQQALSKPFAERLQAICRAEGLGNPTLEQCIKLVNEENASLRGAIDRAEDGCFLDSGALAVA